MFLSLHNSNHLVSRNPFSNSRLTTMPLYIDLLAWSSYTSCINTQASLSMPRQFSQAYQRLHDSCQYHTTDALCSPPSKTIVLLFLPSSCSIISFLLLATIIVHPVLPLLLAAPIFVGMLLLLLPPLLLCVLPHELPTTVLTTPSRLLLTALAGLQVTLATHAVVMASGSAGGSGAEGVPAARAHRAKGQPSCFGHPVAQSEHSRQPQATHWLVAVPRL